jgi:transposase-like protein
MNIIEQGQRFVQSLQQLAGRAVWEWRCCAHCGGTDTCKHGSYSRHPWFFEGRREVRVQRHLCHDCGRTYSEQSALLVRGSWYAREVHRWAIDHWLHAGSSLRRTAEWLRSWLGRQERWRLWRPLDRVSAGPRSYLAASTIHRWLDGAGQKAQQSVAGQLEGVPISRQLGTDGLWARLRGGAKRVVLLVTDSVSGVIWPPVVQAGEESEEPWAQLFQRARSAGLPLQALRGVTSDGCHGLTAYLRQQLQWVNHQRCHWHLWRGLASQMLAARRQAAAGLVGEAAKAARQQARRQLSALVRAVFDAASYEQAEVALMALRAHPLGQDLWRTVGEQMNAALIHLLPYNHRLVRVAPEWCWRDYRLRLSRGRNHASEERLERASLLWAIYRNFEPAQWRSERKRHYRRPGQSPLAMAGVPPGEVSYLDALCV